MSSMLISLVFVTQTVLASAPLVPDKPNKAVPDRNYDILRLHLDLDLQFRRVGIGGTARYTVAQLQEGDFVLDQVALDISSVMVDGDAVPFRTVNDHLRIDMPDRIVRGEKADVLIQYQATPRKGLHFRDVVRGSPDSYPEVWTQGQKNDNRYWFPAWDHPNDRFEYTGKCVGQKDGLSIQIQAWNLPSSPHHDCGGAVPSHG